MSYISFCGLKCDECPLYLATKNNDDQAKEKLAVECSYDTLDEKLLPKVGYCLI